MTGLGNQGAQQGAADTSAAGVRVYVHGVLHNAGVRASVRNAYGCGPAQHCTVLVEGDVPMCGQLGGVELFPGRGRGLECGVALINAELVDRENLLGVLGAHGHDAQFGRGDHTCAAGAISMISPRMRFSISSRIGRTASTPCPAGSGNCQSR